MAKCFHCGAATILHKAGVPICVACDDKMTAERKPSNADRDKPEKRKENNTKKTAYMLCQKVLAACKLVY